MADSSCQWETASYFAIRGAFISLVTGHAFEARIYAENVPKGFLPATGVLHHYRPVQVSETVRVETGVEQGDAVSMHYDPMVAKLVVKGEDRTAALVKLKDCLSKFQVAGVPTNIEFLLKLASHRAFESGEVETHFIENHKDTLFGNSSDTELAQHIKKSATHSAMLVTACLCKKEINNSKVDQGEMSPLSVWYSDPPFRVNYCPKRDVELEWEDNYGTDGATPMKFVLTYQQDGSYFIEAGDGSSPGMEVKVQQLGDQDFRVEAGGLSVNVTLAVYSKEKSKHIHIWHGSQHHHFWQRIGLELSGEDDSEYRPTPAETATRTPGSVIAPMAGLVVKVLAKNGDQVKVGQPVLVMEAMKMEHVVTTPFTGSVSGLQVAPGQQVADGSVLFIVKDK